MVYISLLNEQQLEQPDDDHDDDGDDQSWPEGFTCIKSIWTGLFSPGRLEGVD